MALDLLQAPPAQVNLSNSFNQTGIYADGTMFSGGLDGYGSALSANLLGTSLIWSGATFNIGPRGAADVLSERTDHQPSRRRVLLARLPGHRCEGLSANLTSTVTYTDGTTASFTQSISDWNSPQNYSGEAKVVTMNHRDSSNGTVDNRTFYVYGYSFALNPTKTVQSISLPNQANVKILGIDLL